MLRNSATGCRQCVVIPTLLSRRIDRFRLTSTFWSTVTLLICLMRGGMPRDRGGGEGGECGAWPARATGWTSTVWPRGTPWRRQWSRWHILRGQRRSRAQRTRWVWSAWLPPPTGRPPGGGGRGGSWGGGGGGGGHSGRGGYGRGGPRPDGVAPVTELESRHLLPAI